MVEPEKKKGESKEQWKVPENPPAKSKRRVKKRYITSPSIRTSLTSATSATSITSLASGMKSMSIESTKEVSDEPMESRHSTSSLAGASPSLLTLIGPSPQKPEGSFPSKKPDTPASTAHTTDDPEIKVSRSSISLKTVKTPSRTSLKSVMSLDMKRPSEVKVGKMSSFTELRMSTSSHPRMSDIQIIEKPKEIKENVVINETKMPVQKPPRETREDPSIKNPAETSGAESVVLWKAEPVSESNQSSDSPNQKKSSIESSVQKVDTIKNTIIQEYTNTIETIKQQNNNLEKIKREMLSITVPSIRKGLERRYFAEEDKLNDELVKAMVLQSRCPYERWPEIPVVPNIYDDCNGVHPHLLMNKARQHISSVEQPPPRKGGGEEVKQKINYEGTETTSSDESKLSPRDADIMFKDLLDKIDRINAKDIQPTKKSSDPLNTVIAHLLKKRKNHLNRCAQCNKDSKSCPQLEGFDEELSRVCKMKLGQLTKGLRKIAGCDCEASKSSDSPTCGNSQSQGTSSSEDDQSTICCSKQDISSLEDDHVSSLLNQLCKPDREPPCCKREKKQSTSDPCSKPNFSQVSNSEASKLLCLFENMAADLKQISRVSCPSSGDPETEMAFEQQKLKEKLREVNAEKEELRCIMAEQESQMYDYRQRYLEAKQQIEEQLHHICQLEKCNECIEDRINEEMKRIQCKFEHNMKQLQMCLEQQTRRLKQCCREKEKLREKLNMCCAELHKEKSRKIKTNGTQNDEQKKLKSELQAAREMYKNSERNIAIQREEIRSLKCELASLRKDTTSILCRSKERVQRQVADLNKRIYELEDDLAKERAHSCCAYKEKERCCRLLENALCESQTAKAQLKTLQAYVKTLCAQLENQKSKSS